MIRTSPARSGDRSRSASARCDGDDATPACRPARPSRFVEQVEAIASLVAHQVRADQLEPAYRCHQGRGRADDVGQHAQVASRRQLITSRASDTPPASPGPCAIAPRAGLPRRDPVGTTRSPPGARRGCACSQGTNALAATGLASWRNPGVGLSGALRQVGERRWTPAAAGARGRRARRRTVGRARRRQRRRNTLIRPSAGAIPAACPGAPLRCRRLAGPNRSRIVLLAGRPSSRYTSGNSVGACLHPDQVT